MRGRRAAAMAVGLGAGLGLAAACGGGSDVPSATLAPVPTTTSVDPYAVPAVVDEAYVNRVLAALDAAVGDVVRLVVRERAVTPEAVTRLEAIYEGEFQELSAASLRNDVRRGLGGYRSEPGNQTTTVIELVSANGACVFSRVQRDYTAMSRTLTMEEEWVGLERREPSAYNPTPWVMVYDGIEEDLTQPPNPCGS